MTTDMAFCVAACIVCSTSACGANSSASTAQTQGTRTRLSLPPTGSSSGDGPKPSAPPLDHSIVSLAGARPACQRQWRCATYLPRGSPVELPAHQLGTFSSRQVLSQHQPVLIRRNHLASCRIQESALDVQQTADCTLKAADRTPASEKGVHWGPAEGQQNQQTQPHDKQQLLVLCSPADTNRFIAADLHKNMPGSYYHIRKPETTQLQMTFGDWCDSWRSWNTSRLLLQVRGPASMVDNRLLTGLRDV